jgi:phage major head subunit gpT-like protein
MAKRSPEVVTEAATLSEPRTVQLPPLSLRANLVPRTVSEADRTVEVIFTTAAPVRRTDFWTGRPYIEVLSLDPKSIRLERFNQGAPLLDSHAAYSVADMLGAIVPGSVELTKTAIVGRVQFSKRAAVEPIWQDVRDGLIRSVSIGYRIYKFVETPGKTEDAPPVRTAVDWEPFEASMVPIPADAAAKVRSGETNDANPCEIVTAGAAAAGRARAADPAAVTQEKRTMDEDERPDSIAEPIERTPVPARTAEAAAEPNERDAGATAERGRVQGIRNACIAGRMTRAFEDKLIADGVALVDAQNRVFDELRKRDTNPTVPGPNAGRGTVEVVGDDPLVHKRAGIENALLYHFFPRQAGPPGTPPGTMVGFELTDLGRQYKGLGFMDIVDIFLRAAGMRITGMNKQERAGAALYRSAGMHTTADFPNLLADVSNKLLRAGYEEAPQTWLPIAKTVEVPDFKPRKLLQVGDFPQLVEVVEHSEFTSGTITEAKEQVQLKTYGRDFTITRQALINDDLNAFGQIPIGLGRSARTLESQLAWAEITANANMGDGIALFHANHGNLAGSGAVISVTTIGAGRAAMRLQKGIDGATLLNLRPAFLIVPAAIETLADQFVSVTLMASAPASVNPFAGRLQVISEARLDANSATAYYLATDQASCPTLFYATLTGQQGPFVDQQLGFDVDGLKIKVRHDVAFKAADWHGVYKNPGA